MKKIIVASFQCETNSRAKIPPQRLDFEYFRGDDIFKKLVVKPVFEENGFTVVPSVYAVALPAANVERETYEYYLEQILDTVRENPDAAGVHLVLHGSMEVEQIGSGELYLVKKIREIVSPECLIALSLDAHANITD
jgi:microcystin degradation protein MlrC